MQVFNLVGFGFIVYMALFVIPSVWDSFVTHH